MIQTIKHGKMLICYNLIRSNRIKTSQITVNVDGITVRVPKTKSWLDIQSMMQQKASWLFKKQLHFADKQKERFSTKSELLVLGKHYKINIITSKPQKVYINKKSLEFHIPQKRHSLTQIQNMYNAYLKNRAGILFPKLTKRLSLLVGVPLPIINIKQLKDRWGSATTNQINLNYNLIKAPKYVIEYVILHELCHFKIKEHSHHFWAMVSHYMPKYEVAIQWLNLNGVKIN